MPKFYVQVFVSYIKILKGLSLLKLIIWLPILLNNSVVYKDRLNGLVSPLFYPLLGKLQKFENKAH